MYMNLMWPLVFLTTVAFALSPHLPVHLEIKVPLKSQSANVHLSVAEFFISPYTVTYGECHLSHTRAEAHHIVSEVPGKTIDRLVWILPSDISTGGCLSAWSTDGALVGRSEPLAVNKYSRQWLRKRQLDRGTRLSKRASIPMTSASGIDANGPWFDGVEALKEKEISTVNVREAKAKSKNVHNEMADDY